MAGYARSLMLTAEQVEAYREEGYLRVSNIFTDEELRELSEDMDRIVDDWWGEESIGWKGPWRDHYLPEGEQEQTRAVFIGNPHFYSAAWGRVIFHRRLTDCVRALVGSNVQWHGTILHAKPPERGTPFPMHQDYPFYPHDGPDFVDCLLHLDDAPAASGCLQVVPGSHKDGPLEHITGAHTRPYLPPEKYHPSRTPSVSVSAKAGDVIFFSYLAIHWSDMNRTDRWRRSVRIGYHDAALRPVFVKPEEPYNNFMVAGLKPRGEQSRVTYKVSGLGQEQHLKPARTT